MSVIDLVKWNAPPDTIVWRFPADNLSTSTQLIVNESQEAFLVRGGVYEGPFGAGRHTLSTENLPLLRGLIGLPFGGRTPFTAEVWYVNKVHNLDIKWGTPDPIQLQDPKFGILISVRAFGQYGIQIDNSLKFLNKLIGTASIADQSFVARYLNGALIPEIKVAISSAIISDGVSVLELAPRLIELSKKIRDAILPAASEYGIAIPQFNVHSINVPDDDPALQKLKGALAMRSEIQILGTNYQQMRSFDVLQDAAKNEGATGALLGAGVGAGLGFGLGSAVSGGVASALQPSNPQKLPESSAENFGVKLEQLEKLATLRDRGILTEEEFGAQKSKILGL